MKYYTEYVNHMLRFYCRFPNLEKFDRAIDEKNWNSVHMVLSRLPKTEKNVIMDVYKRFDSLGDNVLEVCKERDINQEVIWTLINRLSKQIAKERKLI